MAKLTASDAAACDNFGNSVAIDGDTVVVGTRERNPRGLPTSSARPDGATCGRGRQADGRRRCGGRLLRHSVAIDGGTVVVGAYTRQPDGAVYVFRTSDGGATYGQVAKLTASDAASGDYFGGSVATTATPSWSGAAGDDDVSAQPTCSRPNSQRWLQPASDGGDRWRQRWRQRRRGGHRRRGRGRRATAATCRRLLFFYGRSKGSVAEPSGVKSRPEPSPQPPKEVVPAEEAAVVTVAPKPRVLGDPRREAAAARRLRSRAQSRT